MKPFHYCTQYTRPCLSCPHVVVCLHVHQLRFNPLHHTNTMALGDHCEETGSFRQQNLRNFKANGWSFFSVFLCQLPTFSFLFFHDHQNSRRCTVRNEEGILRMLDKPTGTSGSLLVCGIEVTSVSTRILHLN